MVSMAAYAKSGIKGPVMHAAFVPASVGGLSPWGAAYYKKLSMSSTSHHAINPSLAIHKTVPRGQSSQGRGVSSTMDDVITGYRC